MSYTKLISESHWATSTSSLTYTFISAPDLNSNYYDTQGNLTSPFVTDFNNPANFSMLSSAQQSTINSIFSGSLSSYSALFSDVVNIAFSETSTSNTGDIAIGAVDFSDTATVAGSVSHVGAIGAPQEEAAGDIWFDNVEHQATNQLLEEGQEGYYTIIHEIGHSLGLEHSDRGTEDDLESVDPSLDSQKYTIMSYNPMGWGKNAFNERIPSINALYDDDQSSPLFAHGLQLYDIAALQSMYGANTTTRSENNTTYALGQGLGRDGDRTKAFTYTVWDGGGTGDTIDASGFLGYHARIDLREGEFSSIGGNGKGQQGYDVSNGRDIDNVSIAYGTVIENAIGGNANDHITGNGIANTITGGAGDDILIGGLGSDVYKFGATDGDDTIIDSGNENIIVYEKTDLRGLSISLDYTEQDLKVTTIGGHVVTVEGQYATAGNLAVAELQLKTESGFDSKYINFGVFDKQDLIDHGLIKIENIFTTTLSNNDLLGRVGDDFLYGNVNNNSLTGGRGDDIIRGGDGTDTYHWALGDGNDTIIDDWADNDQLILSGGISSDMVTVGTSGSDLTLTIANASGAGGMITINGQASAASTFLSVHVEGITHIEADPITTTYLWGTEVYNEQTQQNETVDQDDTITGSAANDHIDGLNDDDTLSGAGGDDFIEGGYGSGDILNGGAGNDRLEDIDGGTLNGDADNDTLIAWGNAVLNGGTGDDIIIANGMTSTINGGDDNDIISVTTWGASANIDGGLGNDVYHLADGTTTTVIAGQGNDVIYSEGDTTIQFLGTDDVEDLTITFEPNARDLLIVHSAGSVILADYLQHPEIWMIKFGPSGTPINVDTLNVDFSYTSTETVYFGGGAAVNVANITTGSGSDTIETSDTDTTVTAGAGQDVITAGDGADTVYGGDDIDTIDGGAGDDVLYGDGGDDVILGGTGANTIYGGAGSDTITNDGSGVVYGDAGNDVITNNGTGVVYGGDGNDVIDGSGDLNGGAGDDTIDALSGSGTGTIHGDDGDDFINAGATTGTKTIYGDGGNDTILAQLGSNIIDGGDGNDTITLGSGLAVNGSTVYGGTGNDVIHAIGSNNTISGGADDDTISVVGADNVIDGGSGNNTINIQDGENKVLFSSGMSAVSLSSIYASAVVDFGGAHSFSTLTFSYADNSGDILVTDGTSTVRMGDFMLDPTRWQAAFGSTGQAFSITNTVSSYGSATEALSITAMAGTNDDVTTGSGNDVIATDDGADLVHAGAGNDDVNGGTGNDILYGDDGDDLLGGDAGADLLYGGVGLDTIYGGADNDEVHAGSDADTVWGEDGDDTLYGDDGNDYINGGLGADYLRGGADDDILFGDDGDDMIYGDNNTQYGSGNDYIDAGNGNDTVYAWYGDDIIIGGDGNDKLYGDWGDDQIDAGSGNDTVSGGAGNDLIGGFGGIDTINGNDGNDVISGGDDKDYLRGDNGDDILYGDDGHDDLRGGNGNDIIIGGAGNDNMYGDGGADTFVLDSTAASDIIRDFNLSENDLIDISASLIGYDPLQDDLNDFVSISNNPTNQHSQLFIDQDGLGTAYSSVKFATLINRPNLSFEDIESSLITE